MENYNMKRAKSKNGDGTWTKTHNGWTWQKIVGLKENGAPNRKSISGKTQAECRSRMAALEQEINKSDDMRKLDLMHRLKMEKEAKLRGHSLKSETLFGEAFPKWLTLYKAPPVRKATTYTSYLDIYAVHFEDYFGPSPLYSITQDAVQQYYRGKQNDGARKDGKKGGLSAKTIRNHHMLLKDFFEYAVTKYKLEANPTLKTERPEVHTPPMRVLDQEEMLIFLKEIIRETQRVAILTSLFTGFRVGELLALEVSDIDLKNQTVSINKNLVRVKTRSIKDNLNDPLIKVLNYNPEKKTHLIIQHTPKTETSDQKQPISDDLFALIIKHLYFLDQSGWPNPDGLLFPSKKGTYMDPKSFEKRLSAISKRCEMKKVNPHALRHTFATRLVEQQVPLTTVMELMRHSSVSTTQKYISTMTSEKRKAMEGLSVYLHPEMLNPERLNGTKNRMKFSDVKLPDFKLQNQLQMGKKKSHSRQEKQVV